MTDQANPLALDTEIAALCDEAAVWLVCAKLTAQAHGLTAPCGIARLNRLHTGYQPAEVRSEVRGRMYTDSLRSAPARVTADDRAKAEAVKWGVAA